MSIHRIAVQPRPLALPQTKRGTSPRPRIADAEPREPAAATPWQNWTRTGVTRAFLQTCWMGLRTPVRLFELVGRSSAAYAGRHALSFVVGCGIVWGIGWNLVELTAFLHRGRQDDVVAVNVSLFVINCALRLIVAPVALVLLVKFAANLWHSLVFADASRAVSREEAFNLFAYAMGPSILALVPLAGPPVAVAWILALMAVAGVTRQRLTIGNAIVTGAISLFAAAAITAGLYVTVGRAWEKTIYPTVELKKPVDEAMKLRVG